jgi:hypothetical protein
VIAEPEDAEPVETEVIGDETTETPDVEEGESDRGEP